MSFLEVTSYTHGDKKLVPLSAIISISTRSSEVGSTLKLVDGSRISVIESYGYLRKQINILRGE